MSTTKETLPKSRSITATKNYRLFKTDIENRPLDVPKHRKLKASLKQYGFLRCFPIVCGRNGDSHLIVKDGQHRLALAEELGLPVHYVVEDTQFDIATVNSTPTVWRPIDFAQKYAANGKKDYQEGLSFAERHHIPVGVAFGLLAGTVVFKNIRDAFEGGTFRIKEREYADTVAYVYSACVRLSADVRKSQFLLAVMAACRVPDFDAERFIAGAQKRRELLVNYGTRDAFLDMMEEIYNFGRHKLMPLKINATQAMRDRKDQTIRPRKRA